MRRILPFLGFLIVVLALASCSGAKSVGELTPTPMPTSVKPTFTVQQGEIVIDTSISGRIVPVDSQPAFFLMDGNVGTVYVQVGDYVTKGQLLADLAILPDLESQWAQVSAEAKYENTISNNTIRRAEIDLQIAQLNLADLTARGVSQDQLQIAQLQVELAQMNLDEIKANPTLHTAAVKAKQLEQQMQNAQLLAPSSGYIIEAPNSGRSVKKTVAAFTIGDISQLELGASVTDEVLEQLSEGQVVTVTLEAQAEKQFVGTIRLLPYPYGSGKESSGDTTVRVTLNETPEQGGYKLGDRMIISVVLQRKTDILWLPPQAIRTVGVRTFVAVEDASGQQQRVEVTLGLQTYTQVEIVSGLKEGQVVIGP